MKKQEKQSLKNKTMKKFIITLVLAAIPFITFAQSTVFNKFENVEGIESMTISKDMLKMVSSMETSIQGEKTKSYFDLIEGMDHLKMFTTSERKHRKAIKNAVTDYLKLNRLEQLMSFNNEKSNIRVYVNNGGDAAIIKEGLVFIEDKDGKDVVLLSFTGNLNLKSLQALQASQEQK